MTSLTTSRSPLRSLTNIRRLAFFLASEFRKNWPPLSEGTFTQPPPQFTRRLSAQLHVRNRVCDRACASQHADTAGEHVRRQTEEGLPVPRDPSPAAPCPSGYPFRLGTARLLTQVTFRSEQLVFFSAHFCPSGPAPIACSSGPSASSSTPNPLQSPAFKRSKARS